MQFKTLELRRLLEFFDEAPSTIKKGDATSLVSVFGEDLALSLFEHYIKSTGSVYRLISRVCSQKSKKGKRLDAWIEVKDQNDITYYQTEIKNWSAHAIGGKKISINAKEEELKKHRIERFEDNFSLGNKIKKEGSKKVLIEMKLSENAGRDSEINKKPLLIFWDAMHPSGKPDSFFSIDIKHEKFSKLYVFSMSSYVRDLLFSKNLKEIEINMPDVNRRVEWMKSILLS